MKYLRTFTYLSLILNLFYGQPTFGAVDAVDNGYKEEITGLSVSMDLHQGGTLDVQEVVDYDFGTNQRHGIYRFIPIIYKGRFGNPRQKLSDVTVTDIDGNAIPYSSEWNDTYTNIVIGDADKLVSGIKTYKIGYRVSRVVSSEKNGDRFNWDAVGTGWDVPQKNVSVNLKLDEAISDKVTRLACYTGSVGGSDTCPAIQDGKKISIIRNLLDRNSGITLNITFIAGTFPAPTSLEVFFWEQPWYLALPIIALLIYLFYWYQRRSIARGRGTIVPMYDGPKDTPPIESSILLYDRISRSSLAAEVISLATRGYIKIRKVDDKILGLLPKVGYELIKLKTPGQELSASEVLLMDGLFSKSTLFENLSPEEQIAISTTLKKDDKPISVASLSELGEDFIVQKTAAHRSAYKSVTAKKYYFINPMITKAILVSIAVVLAILGGALALYMVGGAKEILSLMAPGAIGLAFVFIIPEKTREGTLIKEQLLGLKMYIKAAEIDRLKFHNAPQKSPEHFEALLPYAIIFGLEKEWAAEFKDIYKEPPSWYDGNFATFSVLALTNDIGNFSSAAMGAAASAAASSSGGFSGGGGGGGGGGSW